MRLTKSYPLIQVYSQRLSVNFDTVRHLKQSGVDSFYSVAMTGTLLTGKSTLLNRLIDTDPGVSRFSVSHCTNPCTKGVYASLVKLESTHQQAEDFLFLEFQGFGRVDANIILERKLLALAVLLSKCVLFNSFGSIDKALFARLAQVQSELPEGHYKPSLVLIQRDFSLQLKTPNGDQISPELYLKASLKQLRQQQMQKIENTFDNKYCFLMSSPNDQNRFGQHIDKLKEYLLDSALTKNTKTDMSGFALKLEALGRMLNTTEELPSLKALNQIESELLKETYSVELTYFKQHIDATSLQISGQLPLPAELIQYKIFTISTNYFKCKSPMLHKSLNSSIKDHNEKLINKLVTLNSEKAKKFVDAKTEKLLRNPPIAPGPFQSEILSLMLELRQSYSFISQTVLTVAQKDLWKQQCSVYYSEYFVDFQNGCKQQSKQLQTMKNDLNDSRNQIMSLKEEKETLEEKVNKLNQQLSKFKQKQIICKQQIQQLEQKQINNAKIVRDRQEQVQKILRQNLTYSGFPKVGHSDKQIQIIQFQQSTQKILESIAKLGNGLQNHQKDKQILAYKEKIHNLTEMNQFLRQKLQETHQNNNLTLIMQQYDSIKAKHQILEQEIIQLAESKNTEIGHLKLKLTSLEQEKDNYCEELLILKGSLKERGKGFELLQKIINQKDQTIQNQRGDTLKRIQSSKQQISKLNRQTMLRQSHHANVAQNFISQIQSLKTKNSFLTEQNRKLHQKIHSKFQKQKQDQAEEILKLNNLIDSLHKDLESTHDSSKQVIEQYETILKDKEAIIQQNNQFIHTLNQKIQHYQIQQTNSDHQLKTCNLKVTELQLEIQRTKNIIQSNDILTDERVKHYEKTIQKLKSQQCQRNSMFQQMLSQLRGENSGNISSKKQVTTLVADVQKLLIKELQSEHPLQKQRSSLRKVSRNQGFRFEETIKENLIPIFRSSNNQFLHRN